MSASSQPSWENFKKFFRHYSSIDLATDFSRMNLGDDFLRRMANPMSKALAEMRELEAGAIANPDENRMVGHYWLRNPALAPSAEIKQEILSTNERIKEFASKVHSGEIKGTGGRFDNLLLIGIGGSALGPQFVANALGQPGLDRMRLFFFDNTDPDGMDRTLKMLEGQLSKTLCIVISKSGGTKETRNGMIEAETAYSRAGLSFQKHSVAITMYGSALDKYSADWITRFPMWDWVGGRTSQLSAVGLLPAALQGLDIDSLLLGAKECDEITRSASFQDNPAAMLAAAWFAAGNGKGEKAMVVLPYKDRLELLSKYLQQLVMESLGKELDRAGNKVNQGLLVFGNKGATDQHSYIQQLRDGTNNFFAVFVEVLTDRSGPSVNVEDNIKTGDYLSAFYMGTRKALFEGGRQSLTITVGQVNGKTVGALIALFERAVGIYAALVNINAYHQPGVQAGKVAADEIIKLKLQVLDALKRAKEPMDAESLARTIGSEDCETVYKICQHLAANHDRGLTVQAEANSLLSRFSIA